MKIRILIFAGLFLVLASCAELVNVLQSTGNVPLTEADVIAGLKEALTTGAKNSAQKLAAENGYYGDAAVKILLPPEARTIVDNISKLPGGEKLVEDVVLRINRAAEDAAKEAAPIFVNSITNMSIADAWGILKGPDNAATNYLRSTTSGQLYNLYKPKIQVSTEKKLIGNVSTKDSWNTLTSRWNTLANSIAGKVANLKPVNLPFSVSKLTNANCACVMIDRARVSNEAGGRKSSSSLLAVFSGSTSLILSILSLIPAIQHAPYGFPRAVRRRMKAQRTGRL